MPRENKRRCAVRGESEGRNEEQSPLGASEAVSDGACDGAASEERVADYFGGILQGASGPWWFE